MSTLFSEDVDLDELKSIDMKSLSNVTISPQMLAVLMSFNLITEE